MTFNQDHILFCHICVYIITSLLGLLVSALIVLAEVSINA